MVTADRPSRPRSDVTTEMIETRPVVVGVDGSSSATEAVRWAAQEAVRRDRPLVIEHVCALVPIAVPYAGAFAGNKSVVAEEGQQWLAAAEELYTPSRRRRLAVQPGDELEDDPPGTPEAAGRTARPTHSGLATPA